MFGLIQRASEDIRKYEVNGLNVDDNKDVMNLIGVQNDKIKGLYVSNLSISGHHRGKENGIH